MVINTHPGTSTASLRRTHRGLVLSAIQSDPGTSRAEIARKLGFSEMAATRITRELLEAGIVEELDVAPPPAGREKKRLGRPRIGLRIAGDGLYAAGITVSAYHSEVSLCDANGKLCARERVAYFLSDDVAETAQHYGRALAGLIERAGIGPDRIVGVGVALAARTSLDRGEIVKSDYFGWGRDGGAFRREVSRLLGLPIEIDNISNAIAIAEMRFGAAKGVPDFVLVHVATLVGAAVMTGGHLVRGKDGVSGLIGHFRSKEVSTRCVCGRQDCLNLSATGFGLLARLGRIPGTGFDRARLEDYASSLLEVVEDAGMVQPVSEAGADLAPALDALCKLLGPEMLILSGYLGGQEDYIRGVRSALSRDFPDQVTSTVPVVQGTIPPGDAAPLLALHHFCYSDRLDFDRFAAPAVTERSSRNG